MPLIFKFFCDVETCSLPKKNKKIGEETMNMMETLIIHTSKSNLIK